MSLKIQNSEAEERNIIKSLLPLPLHTKKPFKLLRLLKMITSSHVYSPVTSAAGLFKTLFVRKRLSCNPATDITQKQRWKHFFLQRFGLENDCNISSGSVFVAYNA